MHTSFYFTWKQESERTILINSLALIKLSCILLLLHPHKARGWGQLDSTGSKRRRRNRMHFDAIKMKVIRSTKNKCLHKGRCLHPSKEEKTTKITYISMLSSTPVLNVGALVNRKHHPTDQYAGSHNTLPLLGPLASLWANTYKSPRHNDEWDQVWFSTHRQERGERGRYLRESKETRTHRCTLNTQAQTVPDA